MLMILSGGGGYSKNPDAYRLFSENTDREKPVLYVALSQTPENAVGHYSSFVSTMASLGIVQSCLCAVPGFFDGCDMSRFGGVYVEGGNTFRLLAALKESGGDRKILDFVRSGGVYFGTSAGAVIGGADVMPIIYMDENAVFLEDTRGLDVLGGWSTVAHYNDSKNEFVNSERNAAVARIAKKYPRLVALSEESALLVDENGVCIQGEDCVVFENGSPRVVPSGGMLTDRKSFVL